MSYKFSAFGIDCFLYDTKKEAWHMIGSEYKAWSATHAIRWYCLTGRASADFLKAMLSSSPRHIAKLSLQGGSDEEILTRIKAYLKRRSARTA